MPDRGSSRIGAASSWRAWNDWTEGAILEPDSRHGYCFLEATRAGLSQGLPDHLPTCPRDQNRRAGDIPLLFGV